MSFASAMVTRMANAHAKYPVTSLTRLAPTAQAIVLCLGAAAPPMMWTASSSASKHLSHMTTPLLIACSASVRSCSRCGVVNFLLCKVSCLQVCVVFESLLYSDVNVSRLNSNDHCCRLIRHSLMLPR